jgi:hypothetical protein
MKVTSVLAGVENFDKISVSSGIDKPIQVELKLPVTLPGTTIVYIMYPHPFSGGD